MAERFYRAPCPGCGAPVEFRSAQSTHAVCPYCQSTVVRQGEVLSRLGRMAELFDDPSPLQLHTSGRYQDRPFILIGRLQYQSPTGVWTEWVAWFDDGSQAFLSEDNGAYVMARPRELQRDMPPASAFRVGATTAVEGQPYTVAFNGQVSLRSAQGELPKMPPLGFGFGMVELRSDQGQVLSLDYSRTPPALSQGQSVRLEDLQLSGLKSESVKEETARQFNCPQCGAAVEVTLASTKTLSCGTCHSLIDVSQGVGGELRHALQDEPVAPHIPLGSQGTLEGVAWQVVGFQHRMGRSPGDDEAFGWCEYLLYNRQRGFSFLVDTEEGWSLVRPITGAPSLGAGARSATYLGTRYDLQYSYEAETTYALGEFYWPVARGQRSSNRDYRSAKGLLSLEQTPAEQTWSSGRKLDAAVVAKAFGVATPAAGFQTSDAGPTGPLRGLGCGTLIVIAVVLIVLVLLLSRCSRCDPAVENCNNGGSYRSTGGAYGGYSGGGGSHK
ncbi:DUF4178 domain-containing protein [Curvibacter sp. HBC28]|uniref:DUF4178 domain-containing protein n=1 Tax=Curvibacter microcysteis TaxID=3026419 RepID=A0ABT5MC91_9BURK|nr:DUF4178 domain-containing protein [Curvibacter sp. HBC28]MDD0814000.1 DUF4178 domain-containing protein [Curvibacter sp. HBC28]